MHNTFNQSYIFMAAVYGGLITGIIYDVYRALRRALNAKKFLTAVFDVLFCACALAVTGFVLYTVNYGQIRAYTFLGFALGFFIYIVGVSYFLNYVFFKAINRFKKSRKNGGTQNEPK